MLFIVLMPIPGKKSGPLNIVVPKKGRYPGPRATPVTDGKKVWMLSRNGDLVCIDFANGKQLWHKKVLNRWRQKFTLGACRFRSH